MLILLLITKKYLKESVIFILILSLFWGYISYKDVQRGYKLQTNKGFIYTESAFGKTVDGVLDYIRLNTNLNDRILIYPEGQLINFLSDRKSDTLVYSLIPLYVELFSEKNIIHRLEIIQPEYILINNWNTGDYYYKELCVDYGLKIADYIKLNYHKEVVYGDLFKMTIYKRNDL